jgi:hypothetical protein
MPQNFLFPQRDQPLLMPVDMREWLPEDDLVFLVLDAVAALDLGEFRRRYRADGEASPRATTNGSLPAPRIICASCTGTAWSANDQRPIPAARTQDRSRPQPDTP